MKIKTVIILLLIIIVIFTIPMTIYYSSRITIHNFVANDMRGNEVKFEQFKGKVLLIVNTATECGFTPQFFQLQELYDKYKDRGFEIIAFPSDYSIRYREQHRTLLHTAQIIPLLISRYLKRLM